MFQQGVLKSFGGVVVGLIVLCAVTAGTAVAENNLMVRINMPAHDSVHAVGKPVAFSGTVREGAGGNAAGITMVWSSHLNGQIGTGSDISSSILSVGNHRISLTATDAAGRVLGTATIRLRVDYAIAGEETERPAPGGGGGALDGTFNPF